MLLFSLLFSETYGLSQQNIDLSQPSTFHLPLVSRQWTEHGWELNISEEPIHHKFKLDTMGMGIESTYTNSSVKAVH